jgi:hypothetical protein
MSALTPSELLDFLLEVAPVLPVFIKGPPGGAKTAMVMLFCESVGMECVVLHGSTCLPEDVVGLPIPNHDERKTYYYPPARLARDKAYCLFLDEFPNASKEVQKSFYSLVQHQRTDSFQMPEGSIVILGGNRAQDQALVNQVSSALINRVCIVEMADSHREWIDYGTKNHFHPWVTDFIAARPDQLRSVPGQSGEPFSSPRSWHILSDGLNAFGDKLKEASCEKYITTLARGTIAANHATNFLAFVKMRLNAYDIFAILKGDKRWPDSPRDRDLLYFLADSFRVHLAKELPPDATDVKGKHKETAHQAKKLLKDLSVISMEIAQKVVAEEDGKPDLPGWLLTEIVRDLPRIAQPRT